MKLESHAYSEGNRIRRFLFAAWLVAICICNFGCTARVNQFKQFSVAGSAYVDAQAVFLQDAGNAAIDADSAILIETRSKETAAELKASLLADNKALRQRLSLLNDIRRHGSLLRAYFVALGDLAESDAPSAIGGATQNIVTSLGEISPRIKNAKIGADSVSDFVGSVTSVVVADFQLAALNAELKARAGAIERELDLQHAAMTTIRDQIKTDLQAELNLEETNSVDRPFLDISRALPADWSQKRRDVLTSALALRSADAAVDATAHLRQAFLALVENRFSASDLPSLLDDINRIVTLAQKVKGDSK